MDKKAFLRQMLTKTLVAFVLISIGYSWGRHSVRVGEKLISSTERSTSRDSYIAVYYLHATFRCETCNTIQKLTQELLKSSYSKPLASGQVKWFEIDFQEQETLASQFEVSSSCVVVALVEKGVVLEFQRLDDVWTKIKDPVLFNQYVSESIDSYLYSSSTK